MASHGHSEACCKVPVVHHDYKEKGTYIEVNGLKCYKVGPSTAKHAILVIYDIFGFKPQTLQGADILAHADDEHHQYQVFMPDFLEGNPLPIDIFPPDTEQKKKDLGEFFSGRGAPPKTAPKLAGIVKALTEQSGGTIEKWGTLGLCWGGKIVSLTSAENSPWNAAAEVHPASMTAEDGAKITVPICVLASKDEPAEDIAGFEKNLKVEHHVETFKDQIHGWMGARGDLKDPKVEAEYKRGYETVLTFFHKHL